MASVTVTSQHSNPQRRRRPGRPELAAALRRVGRSVSLRSTMWHSLDKLRKEQGLTYSFLIERAVELLLAQQRSLDVSQRRFRRKHPTGVPH